MKRILSFVALLALLFANLARATVVQIDTFETSQSIPPLLGSDPIGSLSFGRVTGPGIVLERELTVEKTSPATGRSTDKIEAVIEGGRASVSSGIGVIGWKVTLLYDGVLDNGITGVGVNDLGLNMSLDPSSEFIFDAIVDIPDSAIASFRAYTTLGDYSETSFSYLFGGGVDLVYSIPLSSMTPYGAGVDWDHVNAFEFSIEATTKGTDADFSLGGVRLVGPPPIPEVSTAVSAAGFALIGSVFLLRQRRKTKTPLIESE